MSPAGRAGSGRFGLLGPFATLLLAAGLAAAACGSPQPTVSPPGATPSPAATAALSSTAPSLVPSPSARPSLDPSALPAPATNVTAFFYTWYGTPANDGAWRHWQQNSHNPPDDIASAFYPQTGPFSSRDPQILATQMAQLRRAGVGVIAVSWWGQAQWDDQTLDAVFAAAQAAGLKVAFHLEPYNGQTAASAVADIRYLIGRFGSSPALYRVSRPTSASSSTAARPVFYLFAPSRFVASDLKSALAGLRGTPADSIVMIHSPTATSAVKDGGDGVYTYDPLASPDTFAALVAGCKSANLICSPDVSPGFDNREAVATGQHFVDRQNGAHYDAMWQAAIAAGPEWIGVVSFDEWHEGTQIEPAVDHSAGSRTYTGYAGAWGSTAADAPDAYLNRTAYWVTKFGAGG
jgi:glycoprotein endo-alpha-1,2-mannosidase